MNKPNSDEPYLLEIRRAAVENSGQVYNAIYADEGLSQIESFYLWLIDRLQLPPAGRLLDVSCGSGEVVDLAAKHGLQSTGIDISIMAARRACALLSSRSGVAVSTGEKLPFPDATFDFVTNIGSLEHFLDPGQGVREMARVLRPGGKAFVLLPNTFSLLSNIWIAFRTGETSADEQPLQRYGARIDWTRLLNLNGLLVDSAMKYERPWPRTAADRRYYLQRPKEMLRLLAAPFVPLNLAFCFLFTCSRGDTRQVD